MPEPLDLSRIEQLVTLAIEEDFGSGDVTSEAIVPRDARIEARVVMREPGVVAGLPVAEYVFHRTSSEIEFAARANDGDRVEAGAVIAEVCGPARPILAAERLALNFLQRLSGIATITRGCVEAVKPHRAQVMDTRKTTPGWRYLEKYAVRAGGGVNHRMGLYDMALIKDNHLALLGLAGTRSRAASEHGDAGPIARAVKTTRRHTGESMRVEVEADTLEQVREALAAGADIILLDNMSIENMKQAVRLVAEWEIPPGRPRPLTEASGGITVDRIREVAATGVDRISLGFLTHSAPALDIGLDIGTAGSVGS